MLRDEKCKILVLSGDKVKKVILPKKQFVFILMGEKVFYLDSTIGKMWMTDAKTLQNLGSDHQAVVRKYLSK